MLTRRSSSVLLKPSIDALIDSQVASGRFRSASEVVRAALRLSEDERKRQEGMRNRKRDCRTYAGE